MSEAATSPQKDRTRGLAFLPASASLLPQTAAPKLIAQSFIESHPPYNAAYYARNSNTQAYQRTNSEELFVLFHWNGTNEQLA